jgi:gamma-glutamyl:cysteine ligase YbdK (ATP-grasp superfamily)
MSAPPLHLFEGFGVELEYMIVDADTLDVLPVADQVLHAVAGEYVSDVERGPVSWSNELALHVLELKTTQPVPSFEGVADAFQASVREINDILRPLNGRLMPTAMHPWMDPFRELRLWPHEDSPVYEAFNRVFDCRGHGWANLQSVHLNLPFNGDEEFARLHAAVRLLLPLLPALAASSPVIDGRLTGLLDTRLDVYRSNSARIPSITGLVIPEPVSSRGEYEEKILQRIYRDIAPYDPDGVLQHEWLNARGAIARFERNAIEIRVLDVQECPAADVAICAAIAAVLQLLVAKEMNPIPSEELHAILLSAIRDADEEVIDHAGYLKLLGYRSGASCTARELWRYLFALTGKHLHLPERPLARRIVRALGELPSRERMKSIYGELCQCLTAGSVFCREE